MVGQHRSGLTHPTFTSSPQPPTVALQNTAIRKLNDIVSLTTFVENLRCID